LTKTTNNQVWLNGQWFDNGQGLQNPLCQSLHYGYGVIEGVRGYKTVDGISIFKLEEHTQRLFDGASRLGLTIPYSIEDVINVQKEIVQRNHLSDCYIRPIIFSNSEIMNFEINANNVSVAVFAWGFSSPVIALEVGLNLKTSPYKRQPSALSSIKSMSNYQISIVSYNWAKSLGADDALMMDDDGFVSEATGSNAFVIRDGVVYTPKLGSCLPGISRSTIIDIVKNMGLDLYQNSMSLEDFYQADSVFLVGTAMGVKKVARLDSTIYERQSNVILDKIAMTYKVLTKSSC
jgi:branched-chain amino acid aminotransferase